MKRYLPAAAILLGIAAAGAFFAPRLFRSARDEQVAWGWKQLEAADPAAALRAAEHALKSDPANRAGRALRACALSRLGRAAEAVEAFQATAPASPTEHFLCGSALMMAGRIGPAQAELEQAVAGDPANGECRWALAQLLASLGRREEAIAQAQAMGRSAYRPELGLWLAFKLQHEAGDFAGSHESHERLRSVGDAFRVLPEPYVAAVVREAENLLALGRPDDAEKAAGRLSSGEGVAPGLLIRARAAEARGQRDAALEAYANYARRFGADPAPWKAALAKARAWGQAGFAGRFAAEAARKFPEDPELRRWAAEAPPAGP